MTRTRTEASKARDRERHAERERTERVSHRKRQAAGETGLAAERDRYARQTPEQRQRIRARATPAMARTRHGQDTATVRALLLLAQAGLCRYCHLPLPTDRQPPLDHDHRHCPAQTSCSVCRRGLTCHRCNTLIGLAGDDPATLRLIADELELARREVDERMASALVQGELIMDEAEAEG